MKKFFRKIYLRVRSIICWRCLAGCPDSCSIKNECPGYFPPMDYYN